MNPVTIHRVTRDAPGVVGISQMACGVEGSRMHGPAREYSPAEYGRLNGHGIFEGATFDAEVTCKRCQRSKPKETT